MINIRFRPFDSLSHVPDPTPDPLLSDVLSLQEAADLLDYSPRMINHLWATEKLPGKRVGKSLAFHRATVVEYGRSIEAIRRQMGKS